LLLEMPEQDVLLDADPARLAQVFANLLNNAANYSEPGTPIAVRVQLCGDPRADRPQVAVEVIDRGIGLAPADQDAVFDLFRQIDTRVERSHGGLGIGLTLVQRITQLHGGLVTVHSEGAGQGCTFTVVLPCTEAAAEAQPVPEPVSGEVPLIPVRVLIVDDNHDAADTLAAMVRMIGHQAQALYDPHAVEETVREWRPDLVFLDLGMPRRSGFDVARSLRAQPESRGLRLVAVTGWGQAEDRRRSLDAGFDQHLVKPPELDAVKQLCVIQPGRTDRQTEVE
jgi:CheY-like chemotaxis protein/anti-sigma regulatory factor (Ser/Thr protein kinase)